ncbi:MAG: DUF2809 domain-containing protein [Phycisphaerales bacterium]
MPAPPAPTAPTPPPSPLRRWFTPRIIPAIFGAACIAAGLTARTIFSNSTQFFWWKYVGVLLWCWVVHACVRFVNPRLSVPAAAAWAIGISYAVECLQLTDASRWLSSKHWFLRQVFGEVFSPYDLIAATLSILLVIPLDIRIRRHPPSKVAFDAFH